MKAIKLSDKFFIRERHRAVDRDANSFHAEYNGDVLFGVQYTREIAEIIGSLYLPISFLKQEDIEGWALLKDKLRDEIIQFIFNTLKEFIEKAPKSVYLTQKYNECGSCIYDLSQDIQDAHNRVNELRAKFSTAEIGFLYDRLSSMPEEFDLSKITLIDI